MVDFIMREKSLLSKHECDAVINWFKLNRSIQKDQPHTGYEYAVFYSHEEVSEDIVPLLEGIQTLTENYIRAYPEIDMRSDAFHIPSIRFKWWKPGTYFSNWHSEHTLKYPHRIAGFQIYLSDNNCETEFMNYDNEKSVAGNAIVFPSSWTHTHRGQMDPDGIDRYVISGYYELMVGTHSDV